MELASGTKTMTAAAVTVTLGGLLIIVYGIDHHDIPRSVGGLALATTALTALALTCIRRWVTDTRNERQLLAASQRETVAERGRYFAAQFAMENEQIRFRRDMHAERVALDARLKRERKAMRDEFEQRRATLIAETMEATVLMMRDGKLAPDTAQGGTVIHFPQQPPHQEPTRSRGHGVVSP